MHQSLLQQTALLNPLPRKLLTHVGVTLPPSPMKCVCNCICLVTRCCGGVGMLIQTCKPTSTAGGFIALYGISPVKATRISLWISLRSKLNSLEDVKWSCSMPEMGGSLWQWKLWPPVWNLAHITPNVVKDGSSCHALYRTRCCLWSSMLWKARSACSLPALQVEEDGFNIKEDTKITWRLARGRWEQAEKVEACLVWWHGYVDSLSKIPCGERKTWKESLAAVSLGWREFS